MKRPTNLYTIKARDPYVLDDVEDDDGYDEKRLVAKRQLVEEIRVANEAKYEELARITKEINVGVVTPGKTTSTIKADGKDARAKKERIGSNGRYS